ncbi:hypothetical protein AJ79_08887 [Helicocarpus griseus UAMH5409]|uniref:Uncharacterized protein n=1 Tax=Helicocarpus griseus UAMH5409 TaxID=1447875 RepID=A0A2B7WPA8_9EURO|nr:hypothetical protein AJ79_08887 [Helicocarpus griseus UAMH5409]
MLPTSTPLLARLARKPFSPFTRTAPYARVTRAGFSTGPRLDRDSRMELLPARFSNALKTDITNHHFLAIFYYRNSSIYELDIAVPRKSDSLISTFNNGLRLIYQGSCFGDFLKAKLDTLPPSDERAICLTMANKFNGQIRSFRVIGSRYGVRGLPTVEVQVGPYRDWESHHGRSYGEGKVCWSRNLRME